MKPMLSLAIVGISSLGSVTPALSQDERPIPTVEHMFEAGEFAIFTCSGVFIAGREVEDIRQFEMTAADGTRFTVNGDAPEIIVDRDHKVVSVPFSKHLPPIRAGFREGLGCSVLPFGASVEAVKNLPTLSSPRPKYEKEDLAWPEGPITVPTDSQPYQTALDKVIDDVFVPGTYGEASRTIGVVVLHNGQVVAERYREGFGPNTQYRTWSTAKSLASAVVGAAVEDGILPKVKKRAPIPEWQSKDDPRRKITMENLLHMASGLESVNPERGSDTPAAYWTGIDIADDATSQKLIHEPGEVNHYANYDTLLLMRALKASLPDHQAYLDYPYQALFDKIGMHNTFAETDAYGNYVMSSQVYTTARDLSRFGQLYLNDGVWEGERILPKGWAEYSCTPAPAQKHDHYLYGAQWW
ncbi:MAG: serine hydrolase, partial [Pseudomonadota bacterium]